MKTLFLLLCISVGINALAKTGEAEKKFSVQQLLTDFDSLHALIKSVHPKLYANAHSIATEKAWKAGRNKINRPLSKWEFHKAVAPLVH